MHILQTALTEDDTIVDTKDVEMRTFGIHATAFVGTNVPQKVRAAACEAPAHNSSPVSDIQVLTPASADQLGT